MNGGAAVSRSTPSVALLERCLLALCVWREARGETPLGRRLVAQVVLNRVDDSRWPHDVVDVILQPFQFSSFNKNDPNAVRWPGEDDPAWADCVAATDERLAATVPITPATHYHAAGLAPAWADPMKIVAVEGHHVFYKL